MGGLTPQRIATEWTLPQIAVLLQEMAEPPDPFKPDPAKGEKYLTR